MNKIQRLFYSQVSGEEANEGGDEGGDEVCSQV